MCIIMPAATATEKYGVQRLAKAISEQFNIEYSYFELNNPI